VHHKLEELLDEYLKVTGLDAETSSLLFPAALGNAGKLPCRPLTGAPTPRTCLSGGLGKPGCRLTIRLTRSGRLVSRIFWEMAASSKLLSAIAGHADSRTTNSMTDAGRRCSWRTWRGFGIRDVSCYHANGVSEFL
jgi:hypothetical protein